jgi:hypothetical protein
LFVARFAPEDPQCTQPWRGTVKGKVREEQAKEESEGPYPPSPKLFEGILVFPRGGVMRSSSTPMGYHELYESPSSWASLRICCR